MATNPYESPGESAPEIPGPDDFDRFKVVGDLLYCRKDLDLSDYCFLTGEPANRKPRRLQFSTLPPRLFFIVMSVILLTIGFFGGRLKDHHAVVGAVLGSTLYVFADAWLSKVIVTFGTSDAGRRKHWKLFVKRTLRLMPIFMLLMVVFILASEMFPSTKPIALISGALTAVIATEPGPYARQLSERVFCLHNLPKQMLTKLREP